MEQKREIGLETGFYFQAKERYPSGYTCADFGCWACRHEERCERQEKKEHDAKKQMEREREQGLQNSYSLSF